MKEELQNEKALIESRIKDHEDEILLHKKAISWQKKRLKLVEGEIKELEPVNQMSKVVDEMSQL